MTGPLDVLRVFVPSAAISSDTCVLLGCRVSPDVCCVAGAIDITELQNARLDSVTPIVRQNGDVGILGILENTMQEPLSQKQWAQIHKLIPDGQGWFHLTKSNSELPQCSLFGAWKHFSPESDVVVLIFDGNSIDSSSLLETERPGTNLGLLYQGWNHGLEYCDQINTSRGGLVRTFGCPCSSVLARCYQRVCAGAARLLCALSSMVLLLCDNGSLGPLSCRFIPQPATLQHLRGVATETRQLVDSQRSAGASSKLGQLRLSSLLWRRLVDISLGLLMLYLLVADDNTKLVADTVMTWAQCVASELQRLLHWMMGVPAGLKLNHELAHFLGHFFLYHIYLWTGYLSFLAPLWPAVVHCVGLCGVLGLTTQICLVQDMFSVMTLHSYCFYVYAARLYHLQVCGLLSLWRLFRGKKYNPLFRRLDTSSHDADQLFVGTLMFTILLFLLPTTGLFYGVFMALRVVVLVAHGALYRTVSLLRSLPLYLVSVRLVKPHRANRDVRLHVLTSLPNRPLYHGMELLPVPLAKFLSTVRSPRDDDTDSRTSPTVPRTEPNDPSDNTVQLRSACPPSDVTASPGQPPSDVTVSPGQPPSDVTAYSWGRLVHMLLYGQLIYPWIEPAK